MNEHELLDRLDQRAAAAAADVRAAAAAHPVPEFDPRRVSLTPVSDVSRRRFARPLVGIAAAAVLLAGAGAWWVAERDDDPPDPADRPETPMPSELRPFVATELPDGMTMVAAFDDRFANDDEMPPIGPATVYGPAVTDPRLVVFVLGGWRTDDAEGGLQRFEVDGREAFAGEGGTVVIVPIGEDRAVFTGGSSLGRRELAKLAIKAQVDELQAVLPDDALPDGWQPLLTEPNTGDLLSPVFLMRGNGAGGGPSTVYSAEDSERFAYLGSVPGEEAKMFAATLFAERVEEATVRGQRALVVGTADALAPSDAQLTTVTWLERPGELVRLSAAGVSSEQLLSMAQGVQPVSSAAFADLVERSMLDILDADPADTVGEGRFPDGTRWILRQGPDGRSPDLRVAIAEGTDGSSSEGSSGSSSDAPSGRGFRDVTTIETGGRTFAAGFVSDDVVAVELRRPDGSVLGNANVVTGAGHKGWVTELDAPATVAVALDVTGDEVARTTLTGSGNIIHDTEVTTASTVVTSGD